MRHMLDPACSSAVAALEDEPFYRSITEKFAGDITKRRTALAEYFDYSIREGSRFGRTVHLAENSYGVSVWSLPQPDDLYAQIVKEKQAFLQVYLGAAGAKNYKQILAYMSKKSATVVAGDAWYLSIVAVDPVRQGRGLGQQLVTPVLAEGDSVGATSYLETFSQRNVQFYDRLGFTIRASFREPTTSADYAI